MDRPTPQRAPVAGSTGENRKPQILRITSDISEAAMNRYLQQQQQQQQQPPTASAPTTTIRIFSNPPSLSFFPNAGTPAQTASSMSASPPQQYGSSPSPPRPPVSPLTPPPGQPRRNLTHTTQPNYHQSLPHRPSQHHHQQLQQEQQQYHTSEDDDDSSSYPFPQIPVAPPFEMAPLDFESNPDAIALRSALSVLQIQKRKAEEDLRKLQRAKAEALENPDAFVADLVAGKVNVARLNPEGPLDDDDDDDSDSDGEDKDKKGDGDTAMDGAKDKPRRPAWHNMPGPQNIVRTPHINWAQYAIVGESLDRIHADQVARPTVGVPATIQPATSPPAGPNTNMFDFIAGGTGGADVRMEFVGVSAPYAPLREKIEPRSTTGMMTRRRKSEADGALGLGS